MAKSEAVVVRNLRAEIFCGAAVPSRPDAGVTEPEWRRFLSAHMTGFPGYSVYNAAGHWNGDGRWQGEELTRVIVIYGPNNAAFRAELRKIAEAYAVMFDQDSVMVGVSGAAFAFVKQPGNGLIDPATIYEFGG